MIVCPLNFGLGHATRCIPIIRLLLQRNVGVMIASNGSAAQLLQAEFPHLPHLPLSGFEVQLAPDHAWLPATIARQLPHIAAAIYREHQQLERLVRRYHVRGVISDNRYGCYSRQCSSVFITHQIAVRMPSELRWFEPVLYYLNRWFMRQFAAVWIPDFAHPQHNLSGNLSHHTAYPPPPHSRYVGAVSRWQPSAAANQPPRYDLMVLLSGVEPQRSLLEQQVLEQLQQQPQLSGLRVVVVRGLTNRHERRQLSPQLLLIDHLSGTALQQMVEQSAVVLCRSGYSTLMDLAAIDKAAILVPTPQQTEQAYLAERLMAQGHYYAMQQNALDIAQALTQYPLYEPLNNAAQPDMLTPEVEQWLSQL